MLYALPWSRFEPTTSVVIGTDCIGSCISNYHTIVATVAPKKSIIFIKMKNKNSLLEQFQHLIKKYYWNKSKINTPKTHDCSLYWLGTDISIKNGGFKLILTSPCHWKRRKGWRVILSLYYITLFKSITSVFFCHLFRFFFIFELWFRFMVFNATLNNISVKSWRSVLLVEETGVPGENYQPATSHWQTF